MVLNLQSDKAEEKYIEAKILAGEIYFDEGRKAAIDALEKLDAYQKEEKEAENEKLKEELAKQETAANYMAQGNEAFAQGDYESAKSNMIFAKQSYSDMGNDTAPNWGKAENHRKQDFTKGYTEAGGRELCAAGRKRRNLGIICQQKNIIFLQRMFTHL